jgi:hypothetical protein
MLVDAECDRERAIFKEAEQCILRPEKRASRCIVSASTGSHTRSGVSSYSIHSATQR